MAEEENKSQLEHSNEELLAPLEEAEEGGIGIIHRIRQGFAGVWRQISSFEDRHPWLFFAGASIAIFILILGVVSLFVSPGDKPAVAPETPTQEIPTAPVSTATGVRSALDAATLLGNARIVGEIISPLARLRREGLITAEDPIAALLLAVSQMDRLLASDVASLIKFSGDRAAAYEEYVSQLTALEQRAGRIFALLDEQHTQNLQSLENLTSERAATFATLNSLLLETPSGDELDQAVRDYSNTSSLVARKEIEDEVLLDALNSSRDVIQAAQLRLAGMIANREALVAGITIVDVDGSGVELLENGTVQQYYDISIDLGSQSNRFINRGSLQTTQESTSSFMKVPTLKVLGLEESTK